MKKETQKTNLNETLKKLKEIVSWFESQSEIDVEKGLEYVKEGAELIKSSRERLSQIENEFKEIKKDKEINLNNKEIAKIIFRHAKKFKKIKGERAMVDLRKHLCWYVQGVKNASQYRSKMVAVSNYKDVKNIFKD